MNSNGSGLNLWSVSVVGITAAAATLVSARPGGGGGDTPCFVNNPAYTNACSHWTDNTDPATCQDVTSGTSDPCPGVSQTLPGHGHDSYSVISSEVCQVTQWALDPLTLMCVSTQFAQPVSCKQSTGEPCSTGEGGGDD